MLDEEHKPRLRTPPIVVLIQSMRPSIAAEKRTEGILGNSRRQHYGHAALLVASCVAPAPKNRASELLQWDCPVEFDEGDGSKNRCRSKEKL